MPPTEDAKRSADPASMSIADSPSPCFIEGLPVETMEMIFGNVNFIDQGNFVLASKTILVFALQMFN